MSHHHHLLGAQTVVYQCDRRVHPRSDYLVDTDGAFVSLISECVDPDCPGGERTPLPLRCGETMKVWDKSGRGHWVSRCTLPDHRSGLCRGGLAWSHGQGSSVYVAAT